MLRNLSSGVKGKLHGTEQIRCASTQSPRITFKATTPERYDPAKSRTKTSVVGFSFALTFAIVCARKACEEMTRVKGCIVVTSRKERSSKIDREVTVGRPNGKKVFEGVKAALAWRYQERRSLASDILKKTLKTLTIRSNWENVLDIWFISLTQKAS